MELGSMMKAKEKMLFIVPQLLLFQRKCPQHEDQIDSLVQVYQMDKEDTASNGKNTNKHKQKQTRKLSTCS